MKKFKLSLASQIFIGLILGIIVGAIFYGNESAQSFYSHSETFSYE